MKKIENKFKKFMDDTPNAYYCVDNIRNILLKNGYRELSENESWNCVLYNDKFFVTRNDSSIIAFRMGDNNQERFNIVAAHTDSPSFSVKRNPEMYDDMYLKLNTSGYGSMINYTWLDRPLSIAGRVIVEKDGEFETQLVNIDKDLLIIPSQAIHINREVNKEATFNKQSDMLPLLSLNNDKSLEDIIKDHLKEKGISVDRVYDYDLYLYNRDKAKNIGLNDEMITSPRLDDLACVYPALEAFIDSKNPNTTNVFCAFNNEEIGSLTQQGADSTFLSDTLSRIARERNMNIYQALANSFVISADNAHATHPNAPSKNDPTNKIALNKGVVIKHHTNYTTDGLTSSVFKGICDNAEVPYQDYECKSDMLCGATLGGISQSHVSVDSVDIGIPELAMHSANELIGKDDLMYMYSSLLEFYNSTIIKEKNKIKILNNI